MKPYRRQISHAITGFTLLEIMIAVSIAVVVALLLINPFMTFYRATALQADLEQIISIVEEARKNTLSSYYLDQYGVHFETSRVVLYKGSTFNNLDANNIEVVLHSAVEISLISLAGGGSDLLFDRLTGETSQNGTVTVRLKSGSLPDRIITIYGSGLIEVN